MKINFQPRNAMASYACIIKGVEMHIVFMGEKDTRKGFWVEITAENKKSFYNDYAELGFEIVQSFWGGYGRKSALKFDRELLGFETDIFEVLRENHSEEENTQLPIISLSKTKP